jgi:hypothetical protein
MTQLVPTVEPATTSGGTPRHPLAPLTADEVRATRRILDAAGLKALWTQAAERLRRANA